MVESINEALKQSMQSDDKVIIIGEDVGVDGGVFRVTDGLQKEFGKQRVIDTPLSESGIVGTSIGLAINGMKPIAEIQFSGFIFPAFDQLISHAARYRSRTRSRYSIPMVLRAPCGGGVKALEHHSESFEALYAHMPGIKVVLPSRPYDAKGLLMAAVKDPDPVMFFEHKKLYRSIKEEVPNEPYELEIGKANIVQEGADLTVVTWGAMLHSTLEATKNIKASIEVIDLRTISPLDEKTILDSVKKTGRCVIVQEGPKNVGIGAEISARIAEKDILSLEAPIKRIAGYDTYIPLYQREMEYYPSTKRIKQGIQDVLNF